MTKYILAIDQGTSSSRVLLFDKSGQACFTSQYDIDTRFPESSWVEQDAEQIWQSVSKALAQVKHNFSADEIIACGITNQRETVVAWDKSTGKVLAPAIVWQDRRTFELCQERIGHQNWIRERTGLRLDPYFSASKIHWLLQTNPQWSRLIEQNRLAIATIDAFLLWRLTKGNVYATDITNASRTMLMNINTGAWDSDLLDFWQVPESILPTIHPSDASFGVIDAQLFHLPIPITGLIGDQQGALLGQQCFKPGMTKATFGTGAFLLMNTGETVVQSRHGLLATVAYEINNQRCYGLEGSIYHAGTSIRWLRDHLNFIDTPDESEAIVRQVKDNGGVYFISSYTGLGAPRWDNQSGAKLAGLSLDTSKGHIVRAVLEGVVYQTQEVMTAMQADAKQTIDLCRVDGGMSKNYWFLQFLADQCQCHIEKSRQIELTAKGVAVLAGLGAGVYTGIDDLSTQIQASQQWQPAKKLDVVRENYQNWLSALDLPEICMNG